MSLNGNILKVLACPGCLGDLEIDIKSRTAVCKDCGKLFNFENDVPILLLPDTEKNFKSNVEEWERNELVPRFISYGLIQKIKSPEPFKWFGRKKVFDDVCAEFKKDGVYIDIGGIGNVHEDVVNINISPSPGTDIVSDGQRLALKDDSVDGVFSLLVLEHVPHPELIVSEIFRVLKPGGFVFVTVPFMQVMHSNPKDYYRFTPDGIRIMFEAFRERRLEIASGPAGAVVWVLKEYFALMCPFSNYNFVYLSVREILGWLFYPLVVFDLLLRKKKRAEKLASYFYYWGVKE